MCRSTCPRPSHQSPSGVADTAISSRFGPKGCAAQSPSAECPGAIVDQMRADFAAIGYPLHTNGSDPADTALIKCYPHVALLALLKRDYRVPNKVNRSGQYWKAEKLTLSELIERLLKQFQEIKENLDQHTEGITDFIPAPSEVTKLESLKPLEDTLDGLGDNTAAI